MIKLLYQLESWFLSLRLKATQAEYKSSVAVFEDMCNKLETANEKARERTSAIAKRLEELRAAGEALDSAIENNSRISEKIKAAFL